MKNRDWQGSVIMVILSLHSRNNETLSIFFLPVPKAITSFLLPNPVDSSSVVKAGIRSSYANAIRRNRAGILVPTQTLTHALKMGVHCVHMYQPWCKQPLGQHVGRVHFSVGFVLTSIPLLLAVVMKYICHSP